MSEKSKNIDISVVIPMYGCPEAVPELHKRLVQTIESMDKSFEIIMVDDCDGCGTWEAVSEVCKKDERVIGLQLSRNFGQIRAITAGLDECCGDWVVVMDCDLQDRPEGIPELYNKAQEGYDVVFARRKDRKDKKSVKLFSHGFYKMYGYFTDGAFDHTISNFGISRRAVIDAYCKMREQNRAYTMFIKWLGFSQCAIELQADKRYSGDSSYNFRKKFNMAFEIITAQSNKPLKLSIALGCIFSILAFVYVVCLIVNSILGGVSPGGWRSLMASVWFIGGILLIAVGVLGLYIGNIFNEVKARPLYVVKERLNKH